MMIVDVDQLTYTTSMTTAGIYFINVNYVYQLMPVAITNFVIDLTHPAQLD